MKKIENLNLETLSVSELENIEGGTTFREILNAVADYLWDKFNIPS